MNKIRRFVKHFHIYFCVLFSMYLIFFNTSCGLDDYIMIEAPNGIDSYPIYSSISLDTFYFQFRTNEDKSGYFTGTDIYYKIYNNSSTMESERNNIINLSNAEEFDVDKVTKKLMDDYKYQKLKAEGYSSEPLIQANPGKDYQTVYIRLVDYSEEYPANITVDGIPLNGGKICRPLRTDGIHTFEFGKNGTYDLIPGTNSDDNGDYSISSTATENGIWYVCLFAVGVGMTEELKSIYSNVLHLGDIHISEN